MFGVEAADVAAWPVAIAAVVTAGTVIWRTVVRPVIRWGKRIETAVGFVEHEMTANSGKSMKDAVNRIDDGFVEVRARLARGDERFARLEQRIAEAGPQTITLTPHP